MSPKVTEHLKCLKHSLPSVNPPIYKGLGFLKNHSREDQDFLVKIGGSPYRAVICTRGG